MAAHEHINQHQLRSLLALDFVSDDGNGRELTIGEAKPEDWFDMDHYNALKDDIAKNGIQRPIKVLHGRYLNEGHHRAMAAKELGLSRIPAQNFSDATDPDTYDTHEQSTSWKLYK